MKRSEDKSAGQFQLMTACQKMAGVIALALLMAGCGEDANGNDTIWTGLSGLVIVIIIGVVLLRAIRNKS